MLMLDEVHSGSSDMELILARILPKLQSVTNFKVVLLSATLNMAEFLQRAKDAGLEDKYIQTMDNESRHQELVNLCLPPSTSTLRDNIELAVRTMITFHHNYPWGYPDHKTPIEGTILVFVPGKPEITEIVELLKNNMRRGFTAKLYPYDFHSDTPAQDRDFLFTGGRDPNIQRRDELRSLATGAACQKYKRDKRRYSKKVPCSQAASLQRGGRAGRDSQGVCVRLVTQVEWNNMPPRDPPQSHMDDQTSLYLRLASTFGIKQKQSRQFGKSY